MQVLADGLVAGAIYALVALGFSIRFQAARTFDFSYAAVITLAAYTAGRYFDYVFANPACTVVLACVVAGTFGALLDVVVFRPLRRSGARELVTLLASLGAMVAIVNAISIAFGDRPEIIGTVIRTNSVAVGPVQITVLQFVTIALAFVAGTICWHVYQRTRWGLIMRALADDETLARSFGVRRERSILQATILGSALGGLAAILSAFDTGLFPLLGFQLLLPGVVASVVGGIGRPGGAFLAGIAIGVIQQAAGWFTSTGWQDPILFAILLAFLLFRPQGLFGTPLRRTIV